MANKSKEEPKTAPQPDRWYDLTLGPSFKDESSNKYCTLRCKFREKKIQFIKIQTWVCNCYVFDIEFYYSFWFIFWVFWSLCLEICIDEFKPASIDKTKPGLLRKTKENRVSVEFQNNQIGKPKVTFEGNSEEYKENDAVLFFDGRTLRLERLDRAVKQLRHLRMPGESSAAAAGTVTAPAAPSGPALDPRSSPIGKPIKSAPFSSGRSSNQAVPVSAYQLSLA
jgi:ELL-associated factor